MPHFLRRLDDLGFSGINNFPTVGLIDGHFRAELEATNLGFKREVDMIRAAHELGFFTIVYVFNPQESTMMEIVALSWAGGCADGRCRAVARSRRDEQEDVRGVVPWRGPARVARTGARGAG